ncbi:MAG: hypothetical protein NZL93_00170 [Chthoniobacterales bacterium]|nr:hypothetical protein [Chthoniobacterales bacterium]
MFSWFQDYQKGRERVYAVLTVIVIVLLFTIIGLVFYRQHEGYLKRIDLLTRDKVPEELKPAPTPSLVEQVQFSLMEKDNAKARELVKNLEAPESEKAKAYLILGLYELEQGKPDVAAGFFEVSERFDPTAEAFFGRARALIELGKNEEALKAMEFAYKLNPSDVTISNAYHLLQIQNGQAEELRRNLETKFILGLSNTSGMWILAAVAFALEAGNYQLASELLLQAMNMMPYENFKFLIGLEPIKKYAEHPLVLPFYLPLLQLPEEPQATPSAATNSSS